MLNYLEKFNSLPADIRSKVSDPAVMQAISELEKEYNVGLASVVMRVMIKEIPILDLPKFFVFEFEMEPKKSEELTEAIKEKVFFGVRDYLGIITEEEISSEKEIEENIPADDTTLPPVQSSGFFFSSEDEEEIRAMAHKMKNFKPNQPALPALDFDAVIDKTKLDTGLSYSSEELNSRFYQIALTYLKGIRNKIDAKATLEKTTENGGMGMKDIFADNVILLLDKNKTDSEKAALEAESKKPKNNDIDQEKRSKPAIGLGQARDMDYDFKALVEKSSVDDKKSDDKPNISFKLDDIERVKNEIPKADSAVKKIDLEDFVPPSPHVYGAKQTTPVVAEAAVSVPNPKSNSSISIKTNTAVKTGQKPSFSPSNTPSPSAKVPIAPKASIPAPVEKSKKISLHRGAKSGKVKMDDVKYVPKLTGPIDELKEMNLLNFRRLADEPVVCANKIKEKLEFLEDEGYSQRLQGIEAWRLSPLNKMYLSAGNESIANGISVEDVLNNKKAEAHDFINLEEFNAIMQLNKDLRF